MDRLCHVYDHNKVFFILDLSNFIILMNKITKYSLFENIKPLEYI